MQHPTDSLTQIHIHAEMDMEGNNVISALDLVGNFFYLRRSCMDTQHMVYRERNIHRQAVEVLLQWH